MNKKEPAIIDYDLVTANAIAEMQSAVALIQKNALLYDEKNFDQRVEAIDFIDFQIIGRVVDLLQKSASSAALLSLKHWAEKVKTELEEIDIKLFKKLQANIRAGAYNGKEFKKLINEYTGFNLADSEHQEEPEYDNLDLFINGLLNLQPMPEQSKELEPEMVYYQKTPARIIFELVERVDLMKEDVFYDLGSGLGQVGILVNLLAGITTKGVEFEPAFCNYARSCATELNLSNVTYINTDAREADYSQGTVFFMFTPFNGDMLQAVLDRLRDEAVSRTIKIVTYGPCTAQVALQTWLNVASPKDDNIYKLGVFTSSLPRV
jgi:precorrin-6B methylase 2